ncbi:uncharacterized protein FPOAC1_012879 [Fusarium poae]|uniref:uncharacterized protein n=1 Tax=Fusarium poae TaxID=36050 RepID=UPI001D0374DC|nr:uncharacterized protein FPOAC1_013390 [Fusarium poae]XP_044701405.1 uncharacterized protein FPOAC1_012879 [Fusarium poae]KAG8664610.1 hypothetical protein FPOAC1_013390 [Fusarium poae]KAG8664902.1 hypothetical protein FPOAC1_012879 [Fusarium poae]
MSSGGPIEHTCLRRFKRPPEMLAASALMSCALVCLPTEILIRIFEEANTIDAVCLALTCKRIFQASAMLTIRVPSVAHHRDLLPSACSHIFELLRRFQPQVDRKTRFSGKKKKFGLCFDCLQYRPRKKTHWRWIAREYRRSRGVTAESWKRAVDRWSRTSTAQCPECYCKERYTVLPVQAM